MRYPSPISMACCSAGPHSRARRWRAPRPHSRAAHIARGREVLAETRAAPAPHHVHLPQVTNLDTLETCPCQSLPLHTYTAHPAPPPPSPAPSAVTMLCSFHTKRIASCLLWIAACSACRNIQAHASSHIIESLYWSRCSESLLRVTAPSRRRTGVVTSSRVASAAPLKTALMTPARRQSGRVPGQRYPYATANRESETRCNDGGAMMEDQGTGAGVACRTGSW